MAQVVRLEFEHDLLDRRHRCWPPPLDWRVVVVRFGGVSVSCSRSLEARHTPFPVSLVVSRLGGHTPFPVFSISHCSAGTHTPFPVFPTAGWRFQSRLSVMATTSSVLAWGIGAVGSDELVDILQRRRPRPNAPQLGIEQSPASLAVRVKRVG